MTGSLLVEALKCGRAQDIGSGLLMNDWLNDGYSMKVDAGGLLVEKHGIERSWTMCDCLSFDVLAWARTAECFGSIELWVTRSVASKSSVEVLLVFSDCGVGMWMGVLKFDLVRGVCVCPVRSIADPWLETSRIRGGYCAVEQKCWDWTCWLRFGVVEAHTGALGVLAIGFEPNISYIAFSSPSQTLPSPLTHSQTSLSHPNLSHTNPLNQSSPPPSEEKKRSESVIGGENQIRCS
ncbi:hypothetical protein Drorol1_Dr00005558 [Drosera rotundifolia]